MADSGAALTYDHPRIAALAAEITGNWPQIIDVWEELRDKYGWYLRADLQADRVEFLKQALWTAIGGGHLRALLNRLAERNLTAEGLNAAATPFLGADFSLQSYVNGAWQPQDALINGRRLMEACDHVCRITIDDRHRGTGVLIRPTVVATAAHVVAWLVGGDCKALERSVGRLRISFFDADDLLPDGQVRQANPIHATLHEDWLAHYSPRAPGEGEALYAINSVDGISTSGGPWDLALIRLAEPPRAGLKGHRLWPGPPPAVEFGIHVLHHPADALGAPMGLVWSIGDVSQALGAPQPLRWLHNANTDGGSSGAPCFDNNWRIVALHQAGPKSMAAANQNNRAVPIYSWAERVDALAELADTTPYLACALGEDRVPTPVFGRRQMQARAWRSMSSVRSREQRLFLVLGDARSGKTFTVAVLEELARRAGCRLASLDVRNVQSSTPLEVSQTIVGLLGAVLPTSLAVPSQLTTDLRDLRNEILPRLVLEVEAISADRPLWLVLDGLEACDTAANGVAQVVEGLIGALEDAPHLNLALIGWKGSAQAEYSEVLPGAPSMDDIVQYLLLDLAPPGFQPPAEALVTLRALVAAGLAAQPPGPPYARAAAAARMAAETVRMVIGAFALPAAPLATPVAGRATA